jgi:endonuclease/exonuclease/phosphatase (EEP) superfamily protein YafD
MNLSRSLFKPFFRLCLHPWGVITAAGTVACIGTFLGFLGIYAWYFEILSHFRVQYFLGLCLATLLLLIPRHLKSCAVFGLATMVNLATIVPLYLNYDDEIPPPNGPFRAMLINVNTALGNPERVGQVIQENDPDLLVLEEINNHWITQLQPVTQAYPYSVVEPRADNFGIALYSRYPLRKSCVLYLGTAEVPSISALVQAESDVLTVLAIHTLPPSGKRYSQLRNEQLAAIPALVREATTPVLLLGDLNASPWSPYFRQLLRDSDLKDSSQGRGVQPTWPADRPMWLIPIDHCLYTQGVLIADKHIGPDVGSDHYPVIVDFALRYDLRNWLSVFF